MLDYKSIIIKRYALDMSYKELSEEFSASKSGMNDFICAFEQCDKLSYPLLEGITNYAIYELVYRHEAEINNRSTNYEQPDFAKVHQQWRNVKTRRSYTCGAVTRKIAMPGRSSPISIGSSANCTPASPDRYRTGGFAAP